MACALLGYFLADGERFPTVPPEVAERVGWMVFALFVALVVYALCRIRSVRHALLALEDPRTFAILRVGFAILTFVCFVNLFPYWRMLWSDEGIFDLTYAQDRLGRAALRGWAPLPADAGGSERISWWLHLGFVDVWAFAYFLWNKPSLFFMFGSPAFVNGFMAAFFAVLFLYCIGMFSRITGVLAWLMMSMVYNRNALYLEGTDTVYRCFWVILIFAKTGHAWSFDNWWRCRRLRRKGRLLEPGEDCDAARRVGKAPVYRRVPAWPRYLFMLQLAAIYITTGAVKTGSVWLAGDALYYSLNLDHFYRFEGATQWASSVFGTNLFRVNTWVTHWWERLFPLALLGVALRFGLRHRAERWYRAQNVPWRLWLTRATLVVAYLLAFRITIFTIPFSVALTDDGPGDATEHLAKARLAFAVIIPLAVAAWFAVGRWPAARRKRRWFALALVATVVATAFAALDVMLDANRGNWTSPGVLAVFLTFGAILPAVVVTLALVSRRETTFGGLTRRWPWLRIPRWTLDQATLASLLVGRRVWLGIGLIFHGFLTLFMNIGMFAPIMMMTYAAWLSGDEFVRMFRWVVARLRRLRWVPRFVASPAVDAWLADAEPAAHVAVRGRQIPDLVVVAFAAMGVGLVYARIEGAQWVKTGTYSWLGLMAVSALVARLMRPRPAALVHAQERGPALAYGAWGRALALFAVLWHASAVALHLLPSYSMFSKWRSPARAVFSSWLSGTATTQSWSMFAPNPPRANAFMKTLVVLDNGERWDLRNNAWEYRPNPWIINDRMRKMQRRMIGKGKWYLRYWAEFQCREWALERGEVPHQVDLHKIVTHIPKPEVVNVWQPSRFKGRKDPRTGTTSGHAYDPRRLVAREMEIQTHRCVGKGLIPPWMKERYGLPLTEQDLVQLQADKDARARKFHDRRERWEDRNDWGRWFADRDDDAERHRAARARRKRSSGGFSRTGRAEKSGGDGE